MSEAIPNNITDNMTSNRTVAILNTEAPFSSAAGKESLDAALIFGSYEQAISLFFIS